MTFLYRPSVFKKFLGFSLFVACSLLLSVSQLQAKPGKKSYYVKVASANSKEQHRGTLKSADEKGIYIIKKKGEAAQFIPAEQIRSIKLRKKGAAGTGAAIGMATGLAGGLALASITHSDDKLANAAGAVGAAFITFLGGAIGGSIGGSYKEVILINGRSENYLQKLTLLKSFTQP